MLVHVTGEDTDILINMRTPDIREFIQAHGTGNREQTRSDFRRAMETLIKGHFYIRFDDECDKCVDMPGSFTSPHCPNHECVNGFPPTPILANLMKRFPAARNEFACDYIDRIKAEWRKSRTKK